MWRMLAGALMLVAAGFPEAADVSGVPVLADTMRLTLRQAEALLHAHNLELQLGRAALAGATAEGVVAAQRPNPSLSLNTLSVSPSSGIGSGRPWDKQVDSTIRLDQLIERGGKRELRTSAAQMGIVASRSDLAELERQQRVALHAIYYDLLLAQERERVALETVALCEQSLNEMRGQSDKLSSADYSRINIDRLKTLNDVRQARAEREKAQLILAYSLGIEGDARRIEAADSWPGNRQAEQGHSPEAILETRHDVRAALARLGAAGKIRDLARAQRARDVSVGVQYERNPAGDGNTYGVGISIPLFINHFYEGEIERAEAGYLAAQLNLERVRLLALAEVARARSELDSAIERVQRYDTVLLRESHTAAANAEDAYRRGAIAVMDLLDARRTLYATRIEAEFARSEHAKSLAAWKAAIGERNMR